MVKLAVKGHSCLYQFCLSFRYCTSCLLFCEEEKWSHLSNSQRRVLEKRKREVEKACQQSYLLLLYPRQSLFQGIVSPTIMALMMNLAGAAPAVGWVIMPQLACAVVNIYSLGTIVPLEQDCCSSSVSGRDMVSILWLPWALQHGFPKLEICWCWELTPEVTPCCPWGKMTWCMWDWEIQTNHPLVQFTSLYWVLRN